MLVLGGSLHHPGGLESFCERAAIAIDAHPARWHAEWWPTDTAYLTPALLPGMMRRLAALRRARGRFDIVWLQWSTLSDLGFLQAARMVGLPIMVTPHLGANARLQRVPALRRLCRKVLRGAEAIALLYPTQTEEVALPDDIPRAAIRTFLPPESLSRPVPSGKTGPLRLIHAGRLSEGKGTFRAVALCAALAARGIDCRLHIVGRGDAATMADLERVIASSGAADRIERTEWLDVAALGEALAAADVLAHLSELDAFPLIVLEALAAGVLPVVGEMAGAASMVAAYDGHVAAGSSAAAAADWLASLPLEEVRRRGAAAAMRVRADYDWSGCAAAAIGAAEAVLARRAG